MITFETYWPLIILGVVPFLWWTSRQTLTDFNTKHLRLATAIRSTIAISLLLALMQPVFHNPRQLISIVYLLDISHSVSPQAIESAIAWIDETDAYGNAAHSVFIPFGANSMTVEEFGNLRTISVSNQPTEGSIDQSGTDLESAIKLASHSFASNHIKRLVLLSDGNENQGSVKDIVIKIRQEGIQFFAMPIQSRSSADSWIEGMIVPERVTRNEVFPIEVLAYSQIPRTATIKLGMKDKVLEIRTVDLNEGINRVGFEVRIDEMGSVLLETELTATGDTFTENNIFRASLVSKNRPQVLYIEGRQESAHYLTSVLESEGIEVDNVNVDSIPYTVDGFDSYETVILSDVRANQITSRQMNAIGHYVQDQGGSLILAGGEAVYGEDGYSGTRLEEILPIQFDLERDNTSVALIIVLDKSGSMGGQKIELAKEASKAAVDVLLDDDLIGIIAFDYNYYWPVRRQRASNRSDIMQNVSMIIAGGETNIYPALREAHLSLTEVNAEVRHVILLSDGRSLPDDYEKLVETMAEEMMTVSTVAVGNGADRELLENIAKWGKGRAYFIEDATMVPKIFTEETQLATQGTLRENPFQPVIKKEVEAFKGIDFSNAPPLLGYVATLAKETSEVLLEADHQMPILARWQYGLGKTVAFTSDVKDRWAAEWLNWEGYGKLWPQLVRETMRRNANEKIDLRIEKRDKKAHITITAFNENGGFLNNLEPPLQVIEPSGVAEAIEMRQSGPGVYEASVPIEQRGDFVFHLLGEHEGIEGTLPYSYPDEYHFYPPNVELLRKVVSETGGTYLPEAKDLFASHDQTVPFPTPLWPYLSFTALLLYLTDLLFRRVRLFEEKAILATGPRNSSPNTSSSLRIS